MKAMTSYIMTTPDAWALGPLLTVEIAENKKNVPQYKDWSEDDKKVVCLILDFEDSAVRSSNALSSPTDSVKGEDAMKFVYSTGGLEKATDAITRLMNGVLVLTEAKYLMRYGGKGPFRGKDSFKTRVSGKFNEMARTMLPDGECISPLRVIVTTDQQLPISVNHIQAMVDRRDPIGSYSDDGNAYEYVICSSKSLRMIVDNPTMDRISIDDYFFFTL